MKQTDHLTGGGFDVPGSQSQAVSESLQRDFGAESNGISILFEAEAGAGPGEAKAAKPVDDLARQNSLRAAV